jgi:ribose transport system substrate-binding protein
MEALDAVRCTALVVGVNAIPEAIAAIAQGRMLATADFNAMQLAYLATECAVRHLRGETIPQQVELPVRIVDRDNCQDWNRPYEQRPVLTLEQWRQTR